MVGVGRIHRGPRSVIVIGGGIVGLSTAWFLQRRGAEVTVLDGAGVDGLTTGGQPQLLAMFDPMRRSTRPAEKMTAGPTG